MALAIKMQQGGETPVLYSFYGKQYDYNDLAKDADQGVNEYLQTLNRGEKDYNNFRSAYLDLMSGIKDGTVTFSDGRFHDSKGRYKNSDKKEQDYYGLMASYIYNKMGKSSVYEKPEDTSKIGWNNGGIQEAFMNEMFNSNNPRTADFLDLDKEENGVRATTNRAAYLSRAFRNIANNWDNTFRDYTDADKVKYIALLNDAASRLDDGTIDPGDYLALSKIVDGIDFRELMSTGAQRVELNNTNLSNNTNLDNNTNLENNSDDSSNKPSYKLKHTSLLDNTYDNTILNKMVSVMQKVPTDSLIGILRNQCYNQHYSFSRDRRIQTLFNNAQISDKFGTNIILNALLNNGKLKHADPNNNNLYYVPGLRTKAGTGWVWDRANNTFTEMRLEDIPWARNRWLVQRNKQGGILKAQQGSELDWYSGITDFNPTGYTTKYGNTLHGMRSNGVYGDAYTNGGIGSVDTRYKTDPNFSDYSQTGKDYGSAVENQQYYKQFTDDLISSAREYLNAADKVNLTDNLFLRWAKSYDASLPTNSKSSFFDGNNLRTSWEVKNNDSYGRHTKTTTDLIDRINRIRYDQLIGQGHNDYLKEGIRYFYKDKNSNKHWIDPELIKSGKYNVSTNGIKTTEGNIDWTDYEITGLAQNQGQNQGSSVDLTNDTKKQNWYEKYGKTVAQDLAPIGIGINRLYRSISANNKIADTVQKSLNPVLKNTYELYSPVTGAFSEMQLRNRQAADLRRQSNQPYTSDASLNAARQFDANRQGNELQYQGFLADDKEIQRTKAEALKRQEDNIQRRTDVANFNRESINQTNRQRAQIEAQRINSNWQSVDTFLKQIEQDLRSKNAERDYDRRVEMANNRSQSLNIDTANLSREYEVRERKLKQKYNDKLSELNAKYQVKLEQFKKLYGEEADYTNKDFYINYIKECRKARDEYYTASDQNAADASTAQKNYIDSLRTQMSQGNIFKKGGKLSLYSIELLHKVMN